MKLSHISLLVLILVLFSFQSVSISENASNDDDNAKITSLKSKYDKKIKFPVPYLLEKHYANQENTEEFNHYAKSMGFAANGNKVQLVVEFNEEINDIIDSTVLEKYDVENAELGKKWLKGYFSVNKLEKLVEDFPEINSVRQAHLAKNTVLTTQGLSLVNATEWQSAGYNGTGVKVAVIDSGFENLNTIIANGDFTSNYTGVDFTGSGFPGTYYHGTECAAIVYDFVPNAEFYLIIVADDNDFEQAKDYCIANGIDVISMSLGWVGYWYGDGQGGVCDTAKELVSNGILVVNSAGNEAEDMFWTGSWVDTNSNGNIEFAGGDETNSMYLPRNTYISLRLTWDNSYSSDQDYDMYLYDPSGRIVAASENYQSGTEQPREIINYAARKSGTYNLMIRKYDADGTSNFRLYSTVENVLEYADASNSIVDPGTAPEVFTVGAIRYNTWNSSPVPIEYFSSQGPTSAGDMKPDICGPDGTVSTYYTTGFYGTSAACPHVAGAAALYWSSDPSFNFAQVRSYLETNAIDCGTVGKDNVFGYGKLELGSPVLDPGKVTLVSPANNSLDMPTTVDFEWQQPSLIPSVYELQVATDVNFSNIIYADNSIPTTTQQVGGLSLGTKYYWRVRGFTGIWEAWSEVWNLTTIDYPGMVTLVSPGNGTTNQPLTVNLSWLQPSGSPTLYHLQVSTNSGFTTTVFDNSTLSSTSQSVSGLAYSTTYYWRVSAYNSVGWGQWSLTWSFTTMPPASIPGQVTLVSPSNGVTRQKSTIVFSWNAPLTGSTPFTYQLQIATDSGFTSLIYDNASLTSTSNRVSGLPKATTLYWRVRAGNSAGWGQWSSVWSLTTK